MIYIYIGFNEKENSVQNKVVNQINELNNNGIDTIGWFFTESVQLDKKISENIVLKPISPITNNKIFLRKYNYSNQIYNEIIKALENEKFDFLYFRIGVPCKNQFRLLRMYSAKTLLYLPSNPIPENYQNRKAVKQSSLISWFLGWTEYFFLIFLSYNYMYLFLLHKLKAIIVYTPEFSNIIKGKSIFKIKTIYNRDGANVKRYRVRNFKPDKTGKIKLLFLKGSSTTQPWAGLDRLIDSINSQPQYNIHLYIAGKVIDPENYNYSFITLTGWLTGDKLDKLVDEVDIGVSNLANYLIGFNETTNLKSRMYFAKGLPFIQSNSMPDIDGKEVEKYYLKIPNNNSIINLKEIQSFVEFIRKDQDHPIMMRNFALENLSWKTTVHELAEEIKNLC